MFCGYFPSISWLYSGRFPCFFCGNYLSILWLFSINFRLFSVHFVTIFHLFCHYFPSILSLFSIHFERIFHQFCCFFLSIFSLFSIWWFFSNYFCGGFKHLFVVILWLFSMNYEKRKLQDLMIYSSDIHLKTEVQTKVNLELPCRPGC